MWDGSLKIITEVRYIPELKRNLISLSTLDQKGFGYKAQDGVLKVIKGSLVVMKGNLRQGLYVLQANTITQQVNMVVPVTDLTEILHKRLGHMSLKGLQELFKQVLLDSKQIK